MQYGLDRIPAASADVTLKPWQQRNDHIHAVCLLLAKEEREYGEKVRRRKREGQGPREMQRGRLFKIRKGEMSRDIAGTVGYAFTFDPTFHVYFRIGDRII